MRRLLLICYMILIMQSVLCGQQWYSTPDAAYHKAVVRIKQHASGNRYNMGTGVCIAATPNEYFILTAGHVLDSDSKPVEVSWTEKTTSKAYVVPGTRSKEPDAVLLVGRHKVAEWERFPHVPMAQVFPPPGTMLEICGYGNDGDGPDNLRHFWAQYNGQTNSTGCAQLETSVVSGDSGGAVIFRSPSGPQVVGVIWGGQHRTKQGLVFPATATPIEQVRRWIQQACPGGNCPPPFQQNPTTPMVPTTPPPGSSPGPSWPPPGPSEPPPGPSEPAHNHDAIIAQISDLSSKVADLKTQIDGLGVALSTSSVRITDLRSQITQFEATQNAIIAQVASSSTEIAKHGDSITKQDGVITKYGDTIIKNDLSLGDRVTKIVQGQVAPLVSGPGMWMKLLAAAGIGGIPGIVIGLIAWRASSKIKKIGGGGGATGDPFLSY